MKKLDEYAALLSEANKKARLTGPLDSETIYREHIADALEALRLIEAPKTFVDIGTGGGIPGLVWGICLPDSKGVLLDSVGKKIRLVGEMASALGCENIEVVNARSEDYARVRREFFELSCARAVTGACALAEYLSPLTAVGGRVVALKGPGVREELDIPPGMWQRLGLSAPELRWYELEGKERCVVVWHKIKPCPAKYPRKPGMAEKFPWNMPSSKTEKT